MPLFTDTLFIWPLFFAAVLFDCLIGEYPGLFHPVVWMGRFIRMVSGAAERFSTRAARFFSGAAIVICGVLISGACTWLASFIYYNSGYGLVMKIAAGIITAFLIKSSFSLSGLLKAAGSVTRALEDGDLESARSRTAFHLVSRDTSSLDSRELSAAVIESISENLTDSIVAPWTFLLLGGPAAAVSYRFINTCDSMLGYRNEKYEWLGKFAARTDDVVNFIPARVAAWFIVAAAGIRKDCSAGTAVRTMFRDHRVTESPNAGWTMSAAAGALGLRLEKKEYYELNSGGGIPGPGDIRRAVRLIRTAVCVSLCAGIVLFVLAAGVFI